MQRGLQADQVAFLNRKIWRGHLRRFRDAAKGNVHMPGVFVVEQLNGIFGLGGWSVEELRREERLRQEIDNPRKPGEKQYKVVIATTVRLTVRDPAGNVLCHRDATATWPGTGPQLSDAYNVADGGAWTAALKRAAMTFGPQFGLGTVRDAKDEGPQGAAVATDWRRATCDDRAPYPTSPHGAGIDPTTGYEYVGEDDEPLDDAGNAPGPSRNYEVGPRDEPSAQRQPEPDRRERSTHVGDTPENPVRVASSSASTPAPQSAPATPPAATPAPTAAPSESRGDMVTSIRRGTQVLSERLGPDAWPALFARHAARAGKALKPFEAGKPESAGGFSDAELAALLSDMRAMVSR